MAYGCIIIQFKGTVCFICLFQVLKLSQVTIGKLSIGHIINLASNDVQRFDLVSLPVL